jgi:hypothetical protein
VTVSGVGIDVFESRNENSLPLTEIAVGAARAGESVRAEAMPAGVSAAMLTAATMSFFMGAPSGSLYESE